MKTILKILFIIFTAIIGISCSGSDFVQVKVTYYELEKGEYTETLTLKNDTKKIKFGNELKRSVAKIEGVEKLTKITALLIGYNVNADISFLNQLTDLELLVIYDYRIPLDFTFLSNLKKLKILYIDSATIKQPLIDLKDNEYLEFITLNNFVVNPYGKYYKLDIQNAGESIKYLDISRSRDIVYTIKMLDSLSKIPYIFLYEPPPNNIAYYAIPKIDESYFKDKPNFIFKNPKEVLPEEYWPENIFALFDESY